MSQPATEPSSAYRRIEVAPLTGALGAEIRGVDLASDLDEEQLGEVRRALLEHLVIFFRDQRLTPAQHLAFGRRFGTLNVHDFVPGMPENPEIMEIVKDAPDRGYNFGGVWHSDVTYLEEPAMGSILYALEAPPYGGDTLFANM
ncbi:MAG: TauD/TfdA family dioxygenase, partial [Gammaproteobacteria bacterium]|nr:TauD/TfdA family dioxygenase [Gammaproteobacteria bacterium]